METTFQSIYQRLSQTMDNTPQIVSIAGPCGVGKSWFAKSLASFFNKNGRNTMVLGLDSFFKSPQERKKLGEWGPEHIRLLDAKEVFVKISSGEKIIRTTQYVREPTKKMLPWDISVVGIEIIIFEGLYVLSGRMEHENLSALASLRIYLTADLTHIKTWRFQQEFEKSEGRSPQQMDYHWNVGILPDIITNIQPSSKNAHMVFFGDSTHHFSEISKTSLH